MDQNIRQLYTNKDDISAPVIDEFGFIHQSPVHSQHHNEDSHIIRSEWYDLLEKYERTPGLLRQYIKHKHMLQRGIPNNLRGRVWQYLLDKKTWKKNSLKICDFTAARLETAIRMEEYRSLAERQSGYEYQIHVDVQRTFRRHYLFATSYGRGQTELFNVLNAFAIRFRKIGYCQGMSDIAAVFLMYYDELEAYEIMSEFFKENRLGRLFDSGFPGLPKLIKMQLQLLKHHVPRIFERLNRIPESLEIQLVAWYLTLFTRFHIRLCLRVWDFMICYGFEICLYFVCAIFLTQEKKIEVMCDEAVVQLIGRLEEENMDENEVVDLVCMFIKS